MFSELPMVINGVPYESSWGEMQSMNLFMTDDWDDNADFSGNFRLTWDLENLYFHAEITDDIEQSAPEEISDVWMYDCIDIVIDLDTNTIDEYYNGTLWTSHVWDDDAHGTLQAIDLWGNNASSVYYDDIVVK